MPLTLEELEARHAVLEASFELIGQIDAATAARTVTASATPAAPRAAAMAQRAGRAQPSPDQRRSASGVRITAKSPGPGIVSGQELSSSDELARVMASVLGDMDFGDASQPRRQLVASASWDYPEERRLTDSLEANTAKLEAICGLRAGRYNRQGALTAAGGICLPVNVDYSVPTWSTTDRPFRDSLPAFQVNRGGLRFVSPPDIGVPDLQASASGAGASVSVWTEATDANPAGATKPVWQVSCGTEQLVYVNAIPTRVQFGNMQSRFAPEQLAADTEQAMSISAREAELELLTLAYNASKQVSPAQYLGATRDLLASVDLLTAQYRYSHRIARNTAFSAVFPEWAKDVIRADMARELAHDTDGGDRLAVTDDQIEAWFEVRNINVTWTIDGLKAGDYGTGGSSITNQFFPILATNAPAPVWPGQTAGDAFMLAWLLFPEGTYQYLDGGILNLGVVRDSVLDAQNQWELFTEVFESVSFRGLEAYQCQSMVLPGGASAGTIGQGGASAYHE
jgi:hypothetical protein